MVSSRSSKYATRVYLTTACLMTLFVFATLYWNRSTNLASRAISSKPAGHASLHLPADSEGKRPRLGEAYGRLPLSFEANRGQTNPRVTFLSRGSGYSLFLTPSEAVLALTGAQRGSSNHRSVVRMKIVGANTASRVEALEELPTRHNYFMGNDPSKWRTGISTYAKVKYHDIYPGVDLVYYGNQQQLEYDFVVAPGTDPGIISLSFEGPENLELDPNGDLILRTSDGEIRQRKPVIYQEVDGNRLEVAGRYVMGGAGEVGFEVAAYDASRPLVIDPVIVYSTFFGGSSAEFSFNMAAGTDGSIYITGRTTSIDFPVANAAQPSYAGEGTGPGGSNFVGFGDAYVARLNAEGSALIYSTYLGGSVDERGSALAVDGSGAAYIGGLTNSPDFPTLNAFQPAPGGGTCNFGAGDFPCFDAFVTKLSQTGAIVYSTYLGGNLYDDGRSIDVDTGGNAYITGNTFSANFPTMNPIKPALGIFQDAFVTKLSPTGGALIYSTFLGGTGGSEAGQAITVDAAGNAYLAGVTNTTDFPVVNAVQSTLGNPVGTVAIFDLFITKISASGSALLFSTYLGGSGDDLTFRSISLDAAGNVYVAGQTTSANFPLKNAIQQTLAGGSDLFVAKLATSGMPLIYSTYFGGSGNDSPNGLIADAGGNIYIVGFTTSTNFPVVNALQATFGGGAQDAFVMKLNPSGSTVFYSTYLGTSGVENASGVALNAFGNVFVLGRTDSPFFPVVNAFQSTYGGGTSDAFIVKIVDAPENRGQCQDGGWQQFGPPAGPFKNQGECIRYFNTGN